MCFCCRFWKPFNPLLGETFELINNDVGYALVAEQVSTIAEKHVNNTAAANSF